MWDTISISTKFKDNTRRKPWKARKVTMWTVICNIDTEVHGKKISVFDVEASSPNKNV